MATKTIYASYGQSGTASYNASYITIGQGTAGSKACLGFDLTCIKDATVNSMYLYMTASANNAGLQTVRIGASASKNWGASVVPTNFSVQATNPSSNRVRRWAINNAALIGAIQGISGTSYLHIYEPGGEMQVRYEGLTTSTSTAAPYIVVDYTPNASTFTLNKSSVEAGAAITMTISPSSMDYTHKAVWSMGTYSQATEIAAGVTSTSLTVPLTWCNAVPSATSGSARVELQTYNGTAQIGSAQRTFTVTVPASVVPTISAFTATRVDGAVPSSWGVYVQGKSKCALSMTAAGVYGSTIASRTITGGGFSSTAASFTTDYLNVYGNVTFTATVTDTRGRTATRTVQIYVYPYSSPTFSATDAYRCLASGTADNSGTYFRAKATFSYSSVDGHNSCTCTVYYRQGESGGGISCGTLASGVLSGALGNGNLDAQNQYYAIFYLTDQFNTGTSIQATVSIPPSLAYALFIHRGGDAVGIGKYNNTAHTLKSAWPLTVDGAITASGRVEGDNVVGDAYLWSRGNIIFEGNVSKYNRSDDTYDLLYNSSIGHIETESATLTDYVDVINGVGFGSLVAKNRTAGTRKTIADENGNLYGINATLTGKITAASASLASAPPEVINSSFWTNIATAKLLRAIGIDVCVGQVASTTTSNTELDVVFASTGGHVMSGVPLVFIMQDSGTSTGFRVTNRSTTGFHVKTNGVYTFGFQYMAVYFGYNTNNI